MSAQEQTGDRGWPVVPAGRDVVLHTRAATRAGGGPEKTILLSAAYLTATRYWVAAAYMHPPNDPGFAVLQRRALIQGCPLLSIPDHGPFDSSVVRKLLAICRRLNVRIWHGHEYKSNLVGLVLRRMYPMKLVTTVHGWVTKTPRLRLYNMLDRRCLRYYDQVVSVSTELYEQVQRLGVPEDRCTLVYNAIEERLFRRQFAPDASPLRERCGVPRSRLVVGAVGRLSDEKGFATLVRAASALLGGELDFELWIAGEGSEEAHLCALISRLGLTERVKLLGFVEDTVGLFHAMDVFVLSSRREGLPNVLLEAMSMSVPVVATRVGGVPEAIWDGQNGLLCEPDDAAALAARLRALLTDRLMRRRLADEGRRTIEEHFTLAVRMAKEKDVYDTVLGLT